jgi:hypothetical protein
MADKKVVIHGRTVFFDTVMDEAAIPGYITAAAGAGHFISPDTDIFIPFPLAEIVIQDEKHVQAGRQEPNNFGPEPIVD